MRIDRVYCLLVVAVCFLVSCNAPDRATGAGGTGPVDAQIETQDADIHTLDTPDDTSCLPHCGDEYEYQQRCWDTVLYFCTPDGGLPGSDPAIYQQEIVIDKCDEEGNPCVPEYANDPDCRWEIISTGECEDWLECDPTDPNAIVQEDVPCQDVDESGNEYEGFQDIHCQKGQLIAGPCEPCGEEICDAIDNDCDGDVDEGLYPCSSECGEGEAICIEGELHLCSAPQPEEEICDYIDNNCNGVVDENQLNACGACGPIPDESCNGIDDDCDGLIDEDLIEQCETPCEIGLTICVNGVWSPCSAQSPEDEVCNGFDDDCNDLVDDGILCECQEEDVGVLIPCMEDPLICGQGFKTCECVTPLCDQTAMTPCKAACAYIPPQGDGVCDEQLGMIMPELCNNWDDNCNQLIDEDLFSNCYSGPEGTVDVGICLPGSMICLEGQWGHYANPEQEDIFMPDHCHGEVLPMEEDICNGADDNCDGVIEEVMEETDIVFIIDGSGSMSDNINAVVAALTAFAANYSDAVVIQWGLVVGPMNGEQLVAVQNLAPFEQFMLSLVGLPPEVGNAGGNEMLYDALYLVVHNLIDPASLPKHPAALAWIDSVDGSVPPIPQFQFNWREDANKVVVVFTDEDGQSYTNPEITQQNIIDVLNQADDVSVYTFTPEGVKENSIFSQGWLPVSVNGGWYELTSSADEMFTDLAEVLDETVCGQ
tara:strand:+ start:48549 stop:50672 length:2124 start_codon:yes stop_codon:yes gene_type:complete